MGIPVKGFERYTIDRDGTITNTETGHVLQAVIGKDGYVRADLYNGHGFHKVLLVHRLVAEHFIPNPDNHPCVNHKDECKYNNDVSNLEWCTYRYNMNYGTAKARRREKMEAFYRSDKIKEIARVNGAKVSKGIAQMTKDGALIQVFKSGKDAARETGINHSHLLECCAGTRKTAGGYIWKYERS